jgi:hypothetical protein
MLDAQTGPKILKQLNRQPLCHDIHELILGRHMESANLTESHLLTDEMDVDLNVLGSAVVDRVCCHIDSADVVTVDNSGDLQGNMKFPKKLSKPTTLCDHMSNSPVLGLRTGPGHCGLSFGRPGHQAVPEEDAEA